MEPGAPPMEREGEAPQEEAGPGAPEQPPPPVLPPRPPGPPPAPAHALTWDLKRSAKGLKVKSDGSARVTSAAEGWHTVRSKELLRGGRHYVEFDVIEVADTPNTWKVVVGAVPEAFDCRAAAYTCVGSAQGGWGYVGGTGHRYAKASGPDCAYGQPFAAGDTVGMLLDFAGGTVSFFRNRVCFGPAFSTLAGPVYAAVAMTGKGTRVAVRYAGVAPSFNYAAEYVQLPAAAEQTDAERHARLERHFAFKLPEEKLDLHAPEWEAPMRELTQMGFAMMDAAEALLVSVPRGLHAAQADPEASKRGVQAALEYLLAPHEVRKPRYEVAANTILRYAPAAVTVNGKPVAGGLADQVVLLTRRLDEAKRALDNERAGAAEDVYRSVLAAVAAKGTVCKQDQDYMERLRKQRGLSSGDHRRLMAEIGLGQKEWKDMVNKGRVVEETLRKLSKMDAKARSKGKVVEVAEDRECIVCLEQPREMVILPCMHVALCEECAPGYQKDGAQCPTCRRAVGEVRKVYW